MSAPLESSITKAIVSALKKRGGFVFKVHGGTMQTAGIPDILYFENGKPYALEVKRPGCKPTELQAHIQDELRKAGVTVAVVHSVDEALAIFEATPPHS